MAIFTSFNCRIIGRSLGKSAVGKAAYIGGRKIRDDRQNKSFNYTKKAEEVLFSQIIAPPQLPSWVYDPYQLWNAVERKEIRKDAQVAREITIALPFDLSNERKIALIKEYTQQNFISEGMIADINIHNIATNPHAHILLTTRKLSPEGNFGKKEREWNKKDKLKNWRYEWTILCNKYLENDGQKTRISQESYKTLGIKKIPSLHVGNNADKEFNMETNKIIKAINSLLMRNNNSFFNTTSKNQQIEKYIEYLENSIENKNIKKKKLNKLLKNLREMNVSKQKTDERDDKQNQLNTAASAA